jgi:hypothetical protein
MTLREWLCDMMVTFVCVCVGDSIISVLPILTQPSIALNKLSYRNKPIVSNIQKYMAQQQKESAKPPNYHILHYQCSLQYHQTTHTQTTK